MASTSGRLAKRTDSDGSESQLAGRLGEPSHDQDPENRMLARMNLGRLEAEVVRDSLLHCADRVDFRMGGQELENSEALTTRRRTLYYSCHPELDGKSQFGALFDAPEPLECYRRTRSVVPQQALALTNSDLVHQLSRDLADQLFEALPAGDRRRWAAFVVAAFEQILSRPPRRAELEACLEFLRAGETTQPLDTGRLGEPSYGAGARERRESLVRVLLNHNDFLAIR